ncbi:MAG: DUF1566 domain-containing protein [Magnetococcales bacterium]|nr:DUF1566 domain-containing protein [Magnetococcales bacterium]
MSLSTKILRNGKQLRRTKILALATAMTLSMSACVFSHKQDTVVKGTVSDGPLDGATITVKNADASLCGSAVTTGDDARYSFTVPNECTYPLTFEAAGGQDLTSNRVNETTFTSMASSSSVNTVNISTLTSLIVQTAIAQSGSNTPSASDLSSASTSIMRQFNFGATSEDTDFDPITGTMDGDNAASSLRAMETTAELVRRVIGGVDSTRFDAALSALATDMADGAINGANSNSAINTGVLGVDGALFAAQIQAHMVDLTLELLTDNLTITTGGDGTTRTSLSADDTRTNMAQAISETTSNADVSLDIATASSKLDNQPVNKELTEQAIVALDNVIEMAKQSGDTFTNLQNIRIQLQDLNSQMSSDGTLPRNDASTMLTTITGLQTSADAERQTVMTNVTAGKIDSSLGDALLAGSLLLYQQGSGLNSDDLLAILQEQNAPTDTANSAPVIGSAANVIMESGSATDPVSFTLSDDDAGDMPTLSVTSSDQSLVRDADLSLTETSSGNWQLQFSAQSDVTGSLNVTLTASDGKASADSVIQVTVTEPANVDPVANAGSDQSVDEASTITLSAAASTDSDGTISSYQWTQTSGTDVTLSDSGATSSVSFTAPTVASAETLVFQLTVTDNLFATHSDNVEVTVNPVPRTLTITGASQSEGNTVDVGVSLNVVAANTITVNYATSDGTAVAGTDYTASSNTLTINSGESSGTITLSLLDDSVDEPDETITITLSSPTNASLDAATATVTIQDDDPEPEINVASASQNGYEGGKIAIPVTLSGLSSRTLSLPFSVTSNDATLNDDYTVVTTSPLSIAPESSSATIRIAVVQDYPTSDAGETITVTLGAPDANASLGDNTAHTLTISESVQPLLAKTGQTRCFDDSWAEITCDGSGHDGEYQKGVAASSPRFTDQGDGTVLDAQTGLVWLKNSTCLTSISWNDALTSASTMADGTCGLTDGSTAGQWRMPNFVELESLMDMGQGTPTLEAGHPFEVPGNSYFWTSTYFAKDNSKAWTIDTNYGYPSSAYDRSSGTATNVTLSAWLVRDSGSAGTVGLHKTGQTTSLLTGDDASSQNGAAWPTVRLNDNGDGTVTDNVTGLIWLQDGNCITNKDWTTAFTETQALAEGACSLTDGSSAGDWRIPNRRELHSLINFGETDFIESGHPFVNFDSNYFWTSTSGSVFTSDAWTVRFGSNSSIWMSPKSNGLNVLPVRGGVSE